MIRPPSRPSLTATTSGHTSAGAGMVGFLGSTVAGRVLATMFLNVVVSALGIVTGTLAARLLGPEGRGEVAAVQNVAGIVTLLALAGLPYSVTYMTSRARGDSGTWLLTAVLSSAALAVPLIALAGWLLPVLLAQQRDEIHQIGRLFLLSVFAQVTGGLPYHTLQGLLKLNTWNLLRLVGPGLWLIALLVAWATATHSPVSASHVLWTHLLVLILYPAIIVPIVHGHISGGCRFSFSAAVHLLEYGLPSLLSTAPRQLNLRLDQLLMAVFLRSRALGQYAVGVAWSNGFVPLVLAVGHVAFPSIANQSDQDAQQVLVKRMTSWSFFLAALAALAWAGVTTAGFIPVMGEPFRPALSLMVWLIPAAGLSAMNAIIGDILRGMGKPKDPMVFELGGLALTAVLLGLLLVRYQATGAAIASLGSYLGSFSIALFLLRKRSAVPTRQLLLVRGRDWSALRRIVSSRFGGSGGTDH